MPEFAAIARKRGATSTSPVVPALAGTQVRRTAALVSIVDLAGEVGPSPGRGRHGAPAARHAGFTLIEILVVTVVIGIALTLAVAQLIPDDRQAARRDVDRVAFALAQARDAAVLGGNAGAVSIDAGRIQHWRRSDAAGERWRLDAAANDADAAPIASEVTGLTLAATPAATGERIVFLPEGVGVPFELRMAYRGLAGTVRGDALGNVTIEYAP